MSQEKQEKIRQEEPQEPGKAPERKTETGSAAEKKPETGIHEECPFHPASPYAISKVGTDLLGRYYA